MLCIFIYCVEFVRNFVGDIMPWKVSLTLLYLEQLAQFAVYVLICQFFITAASKLVGKKRVERWKRGLLGFVVAAYVLMAVQALLIILVNSNKDYLCHTNEFWIQDAIMLSVMLGFIYAAKVISDIINEETEQSKSIETGDF